MSKLGYENLVFARMDSNEKKVRFRMKTLEFYWRPLYSYDKGATKIFTHILFDHYSPAQETGLENILLMDKLDKSEPEKMAKQLSKWADDTKSIYHTNNRLLLLGDDFSFKKAEETFTNIEQLMNYINNHDIYKSKIRIIYSSAEKYFHALRETNAQFPDYNDDDFFPYCAPRLVYWTGFFTSRPYLKGLVRSSGKYLASTSKIYLEEILHRKLYPNSSHK